MSPKVPTTYPPPVIPLTRSRRTPRNPGVEGPGGDPSVDPWSPPQDQAQATAPADEAAVRSAIGKRARPGRPLFPHNPFLMYASRERIDF